MSKTAYLNIRLTFFLGGGDQPPFGDHLSPSPKVADARIVSDYNVELGE